jgi:hypothetical protein
VEGLCTTGGQCGDLNDDSNGKVISIESCQSPGRYLRHCNYHLWAGDYGTGPDYDFTWWLQSGPGGNTVQFRTTSTQFGSRDIEVVPGNNHQVTMITDGDHEQWYLIPAKTDAEVQLGFVGCYQDCSTNSEGQSANRVCDDIVADVTTIDQCKERCLGSYTYMGLACPRAGNAFECWCCNSFDRNSGQRTSLIPASECNGGDLTSGVNSNRHDHCNGWPSAGDYTLDGYYLGGHCRAALYQTVPDDPAGPAVTMRAMKTLGLALPVDAGLTFNEIKMEEGVQCWHDRDAYTYDSVPSALMPGTLYQGNHKSIPEGTEISFTSADTRPMIIHVFYTLESSRFGGGAPQTGGSRRVLTLPGHLLNLAATCRLYHRFGPPDPVTLRTPGTAAGTWPCLQMAGSTAARARTGCTRATRSRCR